LEMLYGMPDEMKKITALHVEKGKQTRRATKIKQRPHKRVGMWKRRGDSGNKGLII
jgi:hypothetical protein